MNSIVTTQFDLLHETTALRDQMLAQLSDADLAFQLPGNPSLGELCKTMGEVQQAYAESFKTFHLDFSYRSEEPGLVGSVEKLSAWFKRLDADLEAALSALTEEDIQGKTIQRGWEVPVMVQFHIYREALLIFYGKASVYLKALGKPLTEQWQTWIA
jgi:hypothetical protein